MVVKPRRRSRGRGLVSRKQSRRRERDRAPPQQGGLRPRALRAARQVHDANGLAQEPRRHGASADAVPLGGEQDGVESWLIVAKIPTRRCRIWVTERL